MNSWRSMRILLTFLLVVVPALVGVLAGSSVESEAAGLSAPQAAHDSDFTLLLIQPDGSLWAGGGDSVGQFAKGDATHTITAARSARIDARVGEHHRHRRPRRHSVSLTASTNHDTTSALGDQRPHRHPHAGVHIGDGVAGRLIVTTADATTASHRTTLSRPVRTSYTIDPSRTA